MQKSSQQHKDTERSSSVDDQDVGSGSPMSHRKSKVPTVFGIETSVDVHARLPGHTGSLDMLHRTQGHSRSVAPFRPQGRFRPQSINLFRIPAPTLRQQDAKSLDSGESDSEPRVPHGESTHLKYLRLIRT